MLESVETIAEILRAQKATVGIIQWTSSRPTTVRLKVPLEIEGEVRAGLFLASEAIVHLTRQQGSIVLVYRGVPLERMNVNPPAAHANPLDKSLPRGLRGLSLPAGAHRYYPWARNLRWPRPSGDNLPVAEAIEMPLDSYAAALHAFCRRTNIVGSIPPPPHEPRLDLQ